MSDDLKQWNKLLQAIVKGVVIPIVGRDLLRIEVDGREQLLYEYLPAQLATQLEVECEPSASIDQVVAAYLKRSARICRRRSSCRGRAPARLAGKFQSADQ